jgi:hypothetical protein
MQAKLSQQILSITTFMVRRTICKENPLWRVFPGQFFHFDTQILYEVTKYRRVSILFCDLKMHKSITCHSLYAIERLLVPQHRHTVVRASLLPIVVFVGLIWNLKLVAEYGFYTKFIKTEKHESHQILELLLLSLRTRVHTNCNTPPSVPKSFFYELRNYTFWWNLI